MSFISKKYDNCVLIKISSFRIIYFWELVLISQRIHWKWPVYYIFVLKVLIKTVVSFSNFNVFVDLTKIINLFYSFNLRFISTAPLFPYLLVPLVVSNAQGADEDFSSQVGRNLILIQFYPKTLDSTCSYALSPLLNLFLKAKRQPKS